MSNLYMAFDSDTEDQIGLLQIQDNGQLMRGLGEWTPVSSYNHHFDDADIVNVSDDFIKFFDMLDDRDNLPTFQQTRKYAISDE